MKKTKLSICIPVLSVILFGQVYSQSKPDTLKLLSPVKNQGSISFILHTDKTYENGGSDEVFSQHLCKLPGLGACFFERNYGGIYIGFQWENPGDHSLFMLLLKELPGPEKYHLLFTWNAEKGLADGYFNGVSFRKENIKYYQPWEVKGSASKVVVQEGPLRVQQLQVLSKYTPEREIRQRVDGDLAGKHGHLLGHHPFPAPIDVNRKKGKLLYASRMDTESSMKDWVMEGPGIVEFENQEMSMRSQIPNPPDGSTGHFNYWCPAALPKKFIAEWEFKPLQERGLCLVFFGAQGKNREDIFDPVMPERDGHFRQYVNDELMNYWIVTYSNHRKFRTTNIATTYLNKSSQSSLLALGQLGIIPGEMEFHRLRLIKEGARIQLLTNDKVCLDFTDPGNHRWGPVLGSGKFSFRQMAFTVGAYRNFKVWEIQ